MHLVSAAIVSQKRGAFKLFFCFEYSAQSHTQKRCCGGLDEIETHEGNHADGEGTWLELFYSVQF